MGLDATATTRAARSAMARRAGRDPHRRDRDVDTMEAAIVLETGHLCLCLHHCLADNHQAHLNFFQASHRTSHSEPR